MKICIDIDEDYFEDCKKWVKTGIADDMETMLANGIPLPKGHGGWVPCQERLPEENGVYLISYEDAVALMEFFNGKWFLYKRQPAEEAGTILAWKPLPEPYKAESEEK